MYAGSHAQQYHRKGNVVDFSSYHSCLFPVLSTWTGYWTTFDEALGQRPGLAYTDTGGGNLVTDSWTSQLNSWVIPGLASTQRPPLAADGTNFCGREAIQCAITGSKGMRGDLGSTIFAVSTRPYIIQVGRNRTAPAQAEVLLDVSNGTSDLSWRMAYRLSASDGIGGRINNVVVEQTGLTTAPYVLEAWDEASVNTFIRKNGGTKTTGAAGSGLSNNANRLSVGCDRNTGNFADMSIVEMFAFTAYPGDTIALRLVSLIMRKWQI